MTILTRMSQFWLLLLLLCLFSRPSHQCKTTPAKSNPTTTESTIKGSVKFKQPETKDTQNLR